MIYKRVCRGCGKGFLAAPRQFVCSVECRRTTANRSRKKWADDNRETLRLAARKNWQRKRICRQCHKEFGAIHANQFLCSFSCKKDLFYSTPWLIEGKRVRGRKSFKAARAQLLASQQSCLACGTTEQLTADHIKPLSAGGSHDIENLQVLCRRCNAKKSTKEIRYGL